MGQSTIKMDQVKNNFSGVHTLRQLEETETKLSCCQLNEKLIVDVARLKLKQLATFLETALPFLNCHFTDYFVKSYWTNLVPETLRIDLESKCLEEVKNCVRKLAKAPNFETFGFNRDLQSPGDFSFSNVPSLELLVSSIEKLNIKGHGEGEDSLCSSFQEVQEVRGELLGNYPEKFVDLEFDKFMSLKKMHEVLRFSEFIACVSCGIRSWEKVKGQAEDHHITDQKQRDICHLVDVGSGKGYLSSFLAMYYDLRVLAIDASSVNTEGCQKRSAKLDKTWPQLVRRANERQRTGGSCTTFGKHRKKKLSSLGISEDGYKENLQKTSAGDIDKNLKSVTELITTKTDLQLLVDTNFSEDKDDQGEKINYGIAGLHTCGNLGANILKLFLNNERAKFICVIPCCYNLVQEDETLFPCRDFHGSKLNNADSKESPKVPWPDGSIGFPLSEGLINYGGGGGSFFLGRNARMLSAYSLPRMVFEDQNLEMPPVLYYRAILQVLLKRHGILQNEDGVTGGGGGGAISEPEARVGRMKKKCENFRDYVTFALEKLGVFDENAKGAIMNDVEQVEAEYATPEMLEKFHKFYLLRTMFASVVEDLILLDRVVYLLEQDCIADVRVVQLFAPEVSPRSHAIVAIKKE